MPIPKVFYITQGDLEPLLTAVLVDENEEPVPLTAATSVKFIMREPNSGTAKINAAASIVGPAVDGRVRYTWTGTDTDTAEDYDAEFEVTWSSGGKTTFPNFGYFRVKVKKQLA